MWRMFLVLEAWLGTMLDAKAVPGVLRRTDSRRSTRQVGGCRLCERR